MRKLLIILAALLGLATLALWEGSAGANGPPPPNPNQVDYWCPGGHGFKYDPASTPFTVPSPPSGWTWTLLVLKAGSEQSADPVNETFPNPVVGQAYSRTDGKDISHAILCKQLTPTTTQYQTTTTQGSTTTKPTYPTTTQPTTTTTAGSTTTQATTTTIPVTTTLCVECTTTTQGTTTTMATTTVPQTTTTAGSTTTVAQTTSTTAGTTTTVRDCCEQTTTTASTSTTVGTTTTAPTTTVAPTTTAVRAAVPVEETPTTVMTELPHTGASSTWVLTALGTLLMLAGWGLLKVRGIGA